MSFLGRALQRMADRRHEEKMFIDEVMQNHLSEKETLIEIAAAAEHLINTMGIMGANKVPVFMINEHEQDSNLVQLLRYAVLDLQSKLHGTTPPALALPDPKEIN